MSLDLRSRRPGARTEVEEFATVLRAGGRSNSLGRAAEVVTTVLADRGRLDELWACVGHDDAYVRMRAIDSFEKVVAQEPTWADPYASRIVDDLTASSQPSIQWHVAQLLPRLALDDARRDAAIAWLADRLATTEVDWIVSVNCMRALLAFREQGHVTADRLRPLFEVQGTHHSKSVRHRSSDFLATLA